MKLQILYVRDIVANAVPFAPMFVQHVGSAIRDFGDQCKDKSTIIGKHPGDYELYHLGEWDDVDAHFTPFERAKQIAVGANYGE